MGFSGDVRGLEVNFPGLEKRIFVDPLQSAQKIIRNLPLIQPKRGRIGCKMRSLVPLLELVGNEEGRFGDLVDETGLAAVFVVVEG